ncbi:MAG: hypothetical protein CVU68_14735, partial [Deltaproteobacteria bacterium HGW-Deltaproteobacteria-3]
MSPLSGWTAKGLKVLEDVRRGMGCPVGLLLRWSLRRGCRFAPTSHECLDIFKAEGFLFKERLGNGSQYRNVFRKQLVDLF